VPLPTAQLDSTPEETYRALRDRYATERDGLTQRWNGVANQRLLAFAAGAGVIGWGLWRAAPLAIALGVLLLALFVALAVYHHRLGKRRRRAAAMYAINDEAVARIGRDWTALPEPPPVALPPDHPFAADLDLVGRASVLQLIDTTSTPFGFRALTAWLLTPAAPAVVRDRQAAVAALAPAQVADGLARSGASARAGRRKRLQRRAGVVDVARGARDEAEAAVAVLGAGEVARRGPQATRAGRLTDRPQRKDAEGRVGDVPPP